MDLHRRWDQSSSKNRWPILILFVAINFSTLKTAYSTHRSLGSKFDMLQSQISTIYTPPKYGKPIFCQPLSFIYKIPKITRPYEKLTTRFYLKRQPIRALNLLSYKSINKLSSCNSINKAYQRKEWNIIPYTKSTTSSEPFVLIDASGLIFRSFYALPEFRTSTGINVNALYGFVRCLIKLRKMFNSRYLVAVFDGPHSRKYREGIYAGYKSARTAVPTDLLHQFDLVYNFCQQAGVSVIRKPGFEADDSIASLVEFAINHENQSQRNNHALDVEFLTNTSSINTNSNYSISFKATHYNITRTLSQIIIVSADKDLLQLLHHNQLGKKSQPRVSIVQPHKNHRSIDENIVLQELGIYPHQIPDYLAMVGDSVDSIPGIPGFGPKTAAKLLNSNGDLSSMLINPFLIDSERERKIFIENVELVKLSRKLTEVRSNLSFPDDLSYYKLKKLNSQNFQSFCQPLRLHKLMKEWINLTFNFTKTHYSNFTTDITYNISHHNHSLISDV